MRGDDRAILTALGAIAALTAADVDRGLLRSARHLHIASFHLLDGLRPGLEDLVAEAHDAGLTVSLDPQGDPGGGDTALLATARGRGRHALRERARGRRRSTRPAARWSW